MVRYCTQSSTPTFSVGSVARGPSSIAGSAQRGRGVTPSDSRTQARVHAMTRQDAQATPTVVTGMIYVTDKDAYVLLNPGSTHSFVSIAFSEHLHKPHTFMAQPLLVSTPMGMWC